MDFVRQCTLLPFQVFDDVVKRSLYFGITAFPNTAKTTYGFMPRELLLHDHPAETAADLIPPEELAARLTAVLLQLNDV